MVKLFFETLTPLHISNGNKLAFGLEYTIRNDVFRKFNFERISATLGKERAFNFSEEISVKKITEIIDNHFDKYNEGDYFYKIKLHPKFYELVNNPNARGQKFVQEFINSNGRFYIPGSSVKGSLLTILNLDYLGIANNDDARIEDKFVIRDSEYLNPENFIVYSTEDRPPSNNLMCLKPKNSFEIDILKMGTLNKDILINRLKSYSETQINLAKNNLLPYKGRGGKIKGADLFEEGLESLLKYELKSDEYLINIGFGGGSWFKVFEKTVPKFESKIKGKKSVQEPAHTSFSVFLNKQTNHIGWCKIKID